MHVAFGLPQVGSSIFQHATLPIAPKCTPLHSPGKAFASKTSRCVVKGSYQGPKQDVPGLKQQSFKIVFSDRRYEGCLLDDGVALDLPILAFVPGLDGKPLPACQVKELSERYVIVSLCHDPRDQSSWEQLVSNISPTLARLRERSTEGLTVVAESFGGALALRFVAANPQDLFKELILLNPGTALMNDQLLCSLTSLLPLLKVDGTERILYKAAAVFLFKVLLTDERRLADSSIPEDEPSLLRSVDIDEVPLRAMLHRVALLKSFGATFNDECIRRLVRVPTTLVASERDRLLNSRVEIERLSKLLPNVKRKIILKDSAHAALLEKSVSLADMMEPGCIDRNSESAGPSSDYKVDQQFEEAFQLGKKIFAPWRQLISPKIIGGEVLQSAIRSAAEQGSEKRSVLLVGNHGVFGILDLSLFFIELKELMGDTRFRSLAHSTHFEQFGEITGGRWSKFVSDLGALPASPRNFYKLLSTGENILLFPGGAREVCRRRGEQNKLFWKSGVDFVRPAARFNAIIVPFSSLGADDSVEILIDGQELQKLPVLGSFVRRWVEDAQFSSSDLMPISSFPPKPDRFYFKFHEPIDTASVSHKDLQACQELYSQIRDVVENGIGDLYEERKRDPKRELNARMFDNGSRDVKREREQTPFDSFLEYILPTFDI